MLELDAMLHTTISSGQQPGETQMVVRRLPVAETREDISDAASADCQ